MTASLDDIPNQTTLQIYALKSVLVCADIFAGDQMLTSVAIYVQVENPNVDITVNANGSAISAKNGTQDYDVPFGSIVTFGAK